MSESLEPHPDDWADLQRRREAYRRWRAAREPRTAADVMAEVMQRRGYASVRTALACREAWDAAAGEPFRGVTEPGAVKRGVLEVTAANSLVVQELSFEKDRILAALQASLPDAGIKQLRFRVGRVS
jgi:predicted nucleic acid-binding Zn ribbon protein